MENTIVHIEDTQYAYLAGIVDGDGYISVEKERNTFCVTNTNYEGLLQLKNFLNMGKIYTCKNKKPQHNKCHYLKFKKKETLQILPFLYRFFIIKKNKAEKILGEQEYPLTPLSMEEKYAYTAGMIDAEGCFSYGTKYSDYTRLSISNTNLQSLKTIQEYIQIGKIKSEDRSGYNYKTCYNLYFSANQIRYLLPKVMPYLVIKKKDAENITMYLDQHKRTPAKERPNRASYYKQRYQNPKIRTKKLAQIKAYKLRRLK